MTERVRPDATRTRPGPARDRVVVGLSWAAVAAITALLVAQRYADAVAGGLGIDLRAFLEAATAARTGGDVYDSVAYTYTPLLAWALVPLVGTAAMEIWTGIQLACGVLAIAFVVGALRERLPGWRAPLVAGIGAVTLFYSSTLSLELFLGQNQLVLLALLALAVLVGDRAPAVAGVVLGAAALVKTWPAALVVWLLRAGQPHRVRALVAVLATVIGSVLLMIAVEGWESVGRLVERTFRLSQQPVDLFSVWYFARQGVPGTDVPSPLAASPALGLVVSGSLVLGIVGLVVLVLMRPGDRSLAMWNLAGATVLLLPVSHAFYHLLMLPLLWAWAAVLLAASGRRRVEAAVALGLLAAWWALAFRLSPTDGGWAQFAAVTSAVVALVASIVSAARLDDGSGWRAGATRGIRSPSRRGGQRYRA